MIVTDDPCPFCARPMVWTDRGLFCPGCHLEIGAGELGDWDARIGEIHAEQGGEPDDRMRPIECLAFVVLPLATVLAGAVWVCVKVWG